MPLALAGHFRECWPEIADPRSYRLATGLLRKGDTLSGLDFVFARAMVAVSIQRTLSLEQVMRLERLAQQWRVTP
jgi:hypothetical protein